MKEKWKTRFNSLIHHKLCSLHTHSTFPPTLSLSHTHTLSKHTLVTGKAMRFEFHRFFRTQPLHSELWWLTCHYYKAFLFLIYGATQLPFASQVALVVKNLPPNAGDIRGRGSVPEPGRSPGGRPSNPLQCSCLSSREQRGLVGCSSWGHKESDTIECLNTCGGGGLVAKLWPTLATPWTEETGRLQSMGFSRQEFWSGSPFPSPLNTYSYHLLKSYYLPAIFFVRDLI